MGNTAILHCDDLQGSLGTTYQIVAEASSQIEYNLGFKTEHHGHVLMAR